MPAKMTLDNVQRLTLHLPRQLPERVRGFPRRSSVVGEYKRAPRPHRGIEVLRSVAHVLRKSGCHAEPTDFSACFLGRWQ